MELQRELLKRIQREREDELRDKKAKKEQADTEIFRKQLTEIRPAYWAAAKALAVSRGRELPRFADFRASAARRNNKL